MACTVRESPHAECLLGCSEVAIRAPVGARRRRYATHAPSVAGPSGSNPAQSIDGKLHRVCSVPAAPWRHPWGVVLRAHKAQPLIQTDPWRGYWLSYRSAGVNKSCEWKRGIKCAFHVSRPMHGSTNCAVRGANLLRLVASFSSVSCSHSLSHWTRLCSLPRSTRTVLYKPKPPLAARYP